MTQKKIEEVLNSLDGCKPASAPDFFYTRLTARMMKEQTGVQVYQPTSWFLKPVFAFAALSVLILLNVFVIMQNKNSEKNNLAVSTTDNAPIMVADYTIAEGNYQYDYALEK